MITDYESWGQFVHPERVEMLEAYSGVDIVAWYGNIERQLINMENDYEAVKNGAYVDKIHTFLGTWRDNEISGSVNREVIEVLLAATSQLAVDPWKLANYFSNLRDQLRKLIASMEELPLDSMVEPRAFRGRSSKPSGPNSFGPTDEPPSGGGAPGPGGTLPPPGGQEGEAA